VFRSWRQDGYELRFAVNRLAGFLLTRDWARASLCNEVSRPGAAAGLRHRRCTALAKTETFERLRRDRKRVEMLFAHLKRILRLGRLRLRGPCGAQFEFMLAAIAQNLRRLAKLVARPPPLPVPSVA
jgi:hypothetical protein